MNWKLKARLQNAIAALPEAVSYPLYYRVQRHAGGLRRINPTSRLEAGIETWRRLQQAGADPVGKTIMEIGTGRMVTIPLAYWLMGAERTYTFDLNPYLRPELIHESVTYIVDHREEVADRFGELLDRDRFEKLIDFARPESFDCTELLRVAGIEYRAPADAAETGLPAQSIDFHTSFTVMEHIPPAVLQAILVEGDRLLRPGGLAIHGIDYSDHFAHSDTSITRVNFLQYSPGEWERWSGNRYMYMNRLRHDDYLATFAASGLATVADEATIDEPSLQALEAGKVKPHPDFASRAPSELAIVSSWIVAQPSEQVETAGV
ncbi:MAG: methyltransferase domain-containing protein [Planctomycetota bacterium]